MRGMCAKSLSALGFLTVVESRVHGLFGGYLILNPAGRPLEFHCTTPVKASRAQEILYGATLKSYLYAEQIGQTLYRHARRSPPLVLTDQEPFLDLNDSVATCVALVADQPAPADTNGQAEVETCSSRPPPEPTNQRFKPGARVPPDLADWLTELSGRLDLTEPFTRIRDAIHEAQHIRHKEDSVEPS